MKKLQLLLFYALVSMPTLLLAQVNFKKGYVMIGPSKKINGFIDFREWPTNPTVVDFKDENGELSRITPSDCSFFKIDDLELYKSASVKISMSRVKTAELSYGINSSSITDQVFLKAIYEGDKVSLYSYSDKIKTRFYIQEASDRVPYELVREIYLKQTEKGDVVFTLNRFRNQLSSLLVGSNLQEKINIEGLDYYEKDLLKVVKLLNGADINGNEEKGAYKKSRIFFGIGATATTISFSSSTSRGNSISNKASYKPHFFGGIDFYFKPSIGKLVFRTTLSAYMNNSSVAAYKSEDKYPLTHKFNQFSIELAPQILYNYYSRGDVKMFAAAGVGANYSAYKNVLTYYIDQSLKPTVKEGGVALQAFGVAIPISLGITYKDKFSAILGYSLPMPNVYFSAYRISIERYKFGLGYSF